MFSLSQNISAFIQTVAVFLKPKKNVHVSAERSYWISRRRKR